MLTVEAASRAQPAPNGRSETAELLCRTPGVVPAKRLDLVENIDRWEIAEEFGNEVGIDLSVERIARHILEVDEDRFGGDIVGHV